MVQSQTGGYMKANGAAQQNMLQSPQGNYATPGLTGKPGAAALPPKPKAACGNLDIIFGTVSRAFPAPNPPHTAHMPWSMATLLPMLIGCCVVLGTRCLESDAVPNSGLPGMRRHRDQPPFRRRTASPSTKPLRSRTSRRRR